MDLRGLQQASAAMPGKSRGSNRRNTPATVAIYGPARSKSGRGDPWGFAQRPSLSHSGSKASGGENQPAFKLAQPVGLLSLLLISEIPRIFTGGNFCERETFMLDLSA